MRGATAAAAARPAGRLTALLTALQAHWGATARRLAIAERCRESGSAAVASGSTSEPERAESNSRGSADNDELSCKQDKTLIFFAARHGGAARAGPLEAWRRTKNLVLPGTAFHPTPHTYCTRSQQGLHEFNGMIHGISWKGSGVGLKHKQRAAAVQGVRLFSQFVWWQQEQRRR